MTASLLSFVRRHHAHFLTRALLVPTALIAVCLVVVPHASAVTDSTFVITGRGYGHGIGLSQYGAEGYAKKGWPYADILRWYYGGDRDGSSTGVQVRTLSSLGRAADPKVLVNIDPAGSTATRTSWTLRSWRAPMLVTGSGDTSRTLSADGYYRFTVTSGRVTVNGVTFPGTVRVRSASNPSGGGPRLVVVKDISGGLSSSYVRYRGEIQLSVVSGRLKAVNVLPMEEYLYGVVPRESPSSWDADALKAQAVAARSYAWKSKPPSTRTGTSLSGVLYCTTYSQVYGGHSRLVNGTTVSMREASSTNSAVDQTRGQVLYHAPSATVITTYFSSSAGGRTANSKDVWFTSRSDDVSPVYYRTVADADTASPNYRWRPVELSGASLAAKVRAHYASPASPAIITGVALESGTSGYVRYVTLDWSNGSVTSLKGDQFRYALGLKSTAFGVAPKYPLPLSGSTRVEQTDGRPLHTGTFSTVKTTSASSGSYLHANASGAKLTMMFRGSGVSWIGPETPSSGKAEVYLDGTLKATLDLYSSATQSRRPLYSKTGLSADSTHTLVIKVLGTRRSASHGTYVGVDAFDVVGTMVKVPRPPVWRLYEQKASSVRYVGSWSSGTDSHLSGGSHVYSRSTKASTTFAFTGTRVRWIGKRARTYGKAWVSIDGRASVLVDLYASKTYYRQTVWESGTLAAGKHTLRVRPSGKRNTHASGCYIDIDAFNALVPAS